MHRKVFLALVVVGCLSVTAYANPTITAGNWVINPAAGQSTDTGGNPIKVLVSGGDTIQAVTMFMQVGDGVSAGQPLFQAMDIIGPGTVFNASNTGQSDVFPFPTLNTFTETVTIAPATLAATGTLAFLTFDATGVPAGTYPLLLTNFLVGAPTDLPPIGISLTILIDGTVTVTPEPGSIVLALFAAGGLCAVVIRRRRRKVA